MSLPASPRRARQREFFDAFVRDEARWRRRNRTYHRLIEAIHRFLIPEGASVLEIGAGTGELLAALRPARAVGIDLSPAMVDAARERHPELTFVVGAGEETVLDERFDYVLLSDLVPFADDLLALLKNARAMSHDRTRVVIHSYAQLWRPVIGLAELLRLKPRKPIENWVTPGDVTHLLDLADFETVSVARRILLPKKIPLLTTFANGVLANVWPLSRLALTFWIVARPRPPAKAELSVSVVIPARNESGTIAEIVRRVPELGTHTELVFVEGGSNDDTFEEIERQIALHPERSVSLHKQTGRGKGDAVRLGFARAQNDVLMILDSDLSVAPEDLPAFYDAIAHGRAEFVNGSRLVYGMEEQAMRALNILGNKFFSLAFTYLLDQRIKDTLCGTKVLLRSDYESMARSRREFGDFDPFGDFDLLLGAAARGLKIVDLPVRYHARVYGTTNISRFTHGLLLLRMVAIGFYRFKYRLVRV